MSTPPAPPPVDDGSRRREGDDARRRAIVAVVLALGVAAVVLFLFAGRGRHPPRLPTDTEHLRARSTGRSEPCLECHARSADVPVPSGHTGREDCDSCHLLPKKD